MIKLTGGSLRGRVVTAAVPDGVRPTASRVREAVFSMVGQDLSGWSMLDPCGGMGLMALEAASRGADPVRVVDRDRAAIHAMRATAERLGAKLDLRMGDARKLALEPADLVYLDPPYAEDIAAWLAIVGPLARRVLVAEARSPTDWPDRAGPLHLDRVRTYGEASVAVYLPATPPSDE